MFQRVRLPGLSGRVFFYTAAIVCAVLGAALAVVSHDARRAARDAERHSLEQAADLTAQLLAGRGRSLAGGARVFVQGSFFRSLVERGRGDDILDQAVEAVTQLDADWVFITDERGTLLAKSDEPGASGTPMGQIPLVAGALEGQTATGYGVSRDTLLFQVVAVPIVVPHTAPLGVLVATKLVDQQLARDVRAATGAEVVFYANDAHGRPRVAATSLGKSTNVAGELLNAGATARTSDRQAGGARTARIGDAVYTLQGATVTTAGGEIVGGFVVARPESATSAELAGGRRSLVVAGLLGLVLALAAAWSAARHVTRPTRALATAAASALDGNYETAARMATEATRGAPPDEIASLGQALATLLEELREKQALVAVLGRPDGPMRGEGPSAAPEEETERPSTTRARFGQRGRNTVPAARPLSTPSRWARPAGALATGAVVAERYVVRDVLGAGGTGIVYKATDLTLGETVAIKMLRPELVADDPRAREELKHELRLTRRISHRNVVRTYDFGSMGGVPFFTMEYVEGASLSAVLAQRGAMSAEVVIALAKQLTRALEAAHEQGVMHGDLKPANVLVAIDGLLKVTDFGVATLVRRPRPSRADESLAPPRLAGAIVGTPEYMAPELLLGAEADARADIYGAGMVLHECLSGVTPFQRDTPRAFFAQKLHPAPLLSTSGNHLVAEPTSLGAIIAWMTAPEPEDRAPSAAMVGAALSRLA
jgi:eukaryotic-like serine/threonine-protein kinase